MQVVTSTMTAIKKMIHANARRAPPARLLPPPLLSLFQAWEMGKVPWENLRAPGTRHPAGFMPLSEAG